MKIQMTALVLVLLPACITRLHGIDDTAGSDPDADGPVDIVRMVDQFDALDRCEAYDDTPVYAATSRWVGSFVVQGDQVFGAEYWVLIANSTLATHEDWEDLENQRCMVKYDVTGTTDASDCVVCDTVMTLQATVDLGESDCPYGLFEHDQVYEAVYKVYLFSDGTSEFSFEGSGRHLGDGTWEDTEISYVTEPYCSFF